MRRGMITAGGAMALMAMTAFAHAEAVGDDPWRSSKAPRKREPSPTKRGDAPAHEPFLVAETDADRQRIRRAEQKRQRQAARQSKGIQAQGGL